MSIDVSALLDRLAQARRREKEQTLFYRALAAAAEAKGDGGASERLNELHADEQHHLSRLTARVLELGGHPEDIRGTMPEVDLRDWEERAREREDGEIAFYDEFLEAGCVDEESRSMLQEIKASEDQHRRHLGGKWMSA